VWLERQNDGATVALASKRLGTAIRMGTDAALISAARLIRVGRKPLRVRAGGIGDAIALSPAKFLFVKREPARPTPDDGVVRLVTARKNAQRVGLNVPAAHLSNVPLPIGNGRAVSAQLDDDELVPFERRLRIVEGLRGGDRLDDVALAVDGPDATVSAALAEPAVFPLDDLTVRVGEIAQVLPAAAIATTATGFRYADATGANGFFREVEYDAAARRLELVGRSAEPIAPIGPAPILSLESTDLYIAAEAVPD
jgi:hypothetical protein